MFYCLQASQGTNLFSLLTNLAHRFIKLMECCDNVALIMRRQSSRGKQWNDVKCHDTQKNPTFL